LKWLIATSSLATIVFTAALFAAFESHMINIQAHIVTSPDPIEKFVLTNPQAALAESPVQPPQGCQEADTEAPIEVPINTCVFWVLRFLVTNTFSTAMSDLEVTDHFAAELDGQVISEVPVEVFVMKHTRGQSIKESFDTQVRIRWCVNGTFDANDPCISNGVLLPGESAFMDVLVFTRLNSSGKQEYTSPGTYEMNSGATAKWLVTVDGLGVQCGPLPECPTTPPIMVRTT
jgi:hypothetical protein